MKKRICSLIIIVLCCVLFASCGVKTDTIVLTWMPTPDIQEQCDSYIEMGNFTKATYNQEEEKIYIEINEKQKEKWLEESQQEISNYREKLKENQHFRMEISEDAKEFVVYADPQMDYTKMAEYFTLLGYDAEVIQVLNGIEEWSIHLVIKRNDTGDEVYSVYFPKEKIKFTADMWEK